MVGHKRTLCTTGPRMATGGTLRKGTSKVSWLDLRRSGLSVIERLALEEVLLRHDPSNRCWAIVGAHDPTFGKRIHVSSKSDANFKMEGNCLVVLGIGGKPKELVDLESVRVNGISMVKRFSGGGTVVVDHSSLLTTFIGRTDMAPNLNPYPRDIMKWSGDDIFGPAFRSMKSDMIQHYKQRLQQPSLVMQGNSCGGLDSRTTNQKNTTFIANETTNDSKLLLEEDISAIPDFQLRENDYILGDRKMGGNAQAIVGGGWLHHTSFLWDFDKDNMKYLTMPSKRPEYRGNRSHDDFIVCLKDSFEPLGKYSLFDKMKDAIEDRFDIVEEVTSQEALELVSDQFGSMQSWFDGKCRTRLLEV